MAKFGQEGEIFVDLEARHQCIEGFGVNINPVGHWRKGTLAPVLDRLVDDLGATIFRLDPFGTCQWTGEEPTQVTTERCEAAYRSRDFVDSWETARYLAGRGAKILLNVSGPVPLWMCEEDGKSLRDVDAYVELLVSLASWYRVNEKLPLDWFGPLNETDIGPPEGPVVAPALACDIIGKLGRRLTEVFGDHVPMVGFDQAWWGPEYVAALTDHPEARSALDVVSMHSYSELDHEAVVEMIDGLKPDVGRWWLTEYGDLDDTGELEWEVCLSSTRRALRGLLAGASAALVWDAYDNWHRHEGGWTIYGLMRTAVNREVYDYTAKRRYFAAKHLYRYVRPGWSRVGTTSGALVASAFAGELVGSDGGDLSIVGLNEHDYPLLLDVRIAGGHVDKRGTLLVSTRGRDLEAVFEAKLGDGMRATVPARSVFTLTTSPS